MKLKKVIVILAAVAAILFVVNYGLNRFKAMTGGATESKVLATQKAEISGTAGVSNEVKLLDNEISLLAKEMAKREMFKEFLGKGNGKVATTFCSNHAEYGKDRLMQDACVKSIYLQCGDSGLGLSDTDFLVCAGTMLNSENFRQTMALIKSEHQKTNKIVRKEGKKTRVALAKHDAKSSKEHKEHGEEMKKQHAATNALIRPPKGKSSPGAVNAPSGGVGANPVSTVVTTSSASSGNRASDLWAKFSTEYALGNSAKYCLTVEEMLADKAVLSASFKPATWDYLQDIYVNKCKPPKKKKWYQRSINTLAMVPKMFTQGTCLNSVFTDGDCNLDLGKAAIGYFGTIGLAKAVLPDWAQDKIGLIDRPQPHSQPSSGGGTNPPADTSGLTGPGTYDPYDGLVSGTTGTVDPNAPNANVFGDVSTANPGEFGGDSITPRPPMPGGVSSIDPGTVGVITTVTTITDVPTSLVGPSDGGAIDSSIGPVGGGSQTLIGPVEGLGGGPNIF